MKKIYLVIMVVIAIAFSSCDKSDTTPIGGGDTNPTQDMADCELNAYGYVDFTNNSSNPYYIYINDNYTFTMDGGTVKDDYHLTIGSYSIKIEQKSGYILYPTIETYSVIVGKCDNSYISFPQKKQE